MTGLNYNLSQNPCVTQDSSFAKSAECDGASPFTNIKGKPFDAIAYHASGIQSMQSNCSHISHTQSQLDEKEKKEYEIAVNMTKSQPTPFNMNRFVLLGIYSYYIILTSSTFFGWSSFQKILFKLGAFEYSCDGDKTARSLVANDVFKCNKQDGYVQALFSICLATNFVMSSFAGFLVDRIGPKIVAMMGQTFTTVGWILLLCSSETFVAYKAAFIFMGLGGDCGFIPALVLNNMFPEMQSVSITIMGAAASISFAIPLVLNLIWKQIPSVSFAYIGSAYIAAGPVLGFLIAAFLFPKKSFYGVEHFQKINKESSIEVKGDQNESVNKLSISDEKQRKSIIQKVKDIVTNIDLSSYKNAVYQEWWVFAIYFIIVNINFLYFSHSANRILENTNAGLYLDWAVPFAFIPCIIFGFLMDYFGVFYVITFVNFSAFMSYLFLYLSNSLNNFEAFASVTFYALFISVFYSQMYCYTRDTFSFLHFGSLVGLSTLVGGLTIHFGDYIYTHFTLITLDGNVYPFLLGIAIADALAFIPIFYLWFRKIKGYGTLKQDVQALENKQKSGVQKEAESVLV